MPWPNSQDYNEAIQDPGHCFADPELKAGEARTTALGIPRARSGNFADVYEVCCPTGVQWAVKCFTREVPRRGDRYQVITRHLRLAKARLPFMVDFTYLEKGIFAAGAWYPGVKMQWVEGMTLNEFVGHAADKPAHLDTLFQIWVKLAVALREAAVAHGDLQGGNVLLVPGKAANTLALRLIDYDGMYVPDLADAPSGEVGHPSYQHPQRIQEATYSGEVDRFPLLLVATALKCLQVLGKPLWEAHDTGDNLLFTQEDLQSPTRSLLFSKLVRVREPAARQLVRAMLDALREGQAVVPRVDELFPVKLAPAPAPPPVPAEQPAAAVPWYREPGVEPVPVDVTPVEPPVAGPAPTPFDFDSWEPPTPPPLPRRRKPAGRARWWVLGGALVLLGVAAFAWKDALRDKPAEPAPPKNDAAKHHRQARMYQEGRGAELDWQKARGEYEAAKEAGHPLAQGYLALLAEAEFLDWHGEAAGGAKGPAPEIKDKLVKQLQTDAMVETDSEAHLLLGHYYLVGIGVAASPARAGEWYQKAAKQLPDADYYLGLTRILAGPAQEWKSARDCFQRAVGGAGHGRLDGKARFDRAERLRNAARSSPAQRAVAYGDYSLAIARGQEVQSAYHQRGHMSEEAGHWQDAVDDLTTALGDDGQKAHLLAHRGSARLMLGEWAKAREDYEVALRVGKKGFCTAYNADREYAHAIVFAPVSITSYEEAVKHARQAVDDEPTKADNWETLALAHYRNKSIDEALNALQDGRKHKDRRRATAALGLCVEAACLAKVGKVQQAEAQLKRAAEAEKAARGQRTFVRVEYDAIRKEAVQALADARKKNGP